MSVTSALVLVALVLAAFDLLDARGRSLLAWAVVLVCVALLWGRLL